MPGILSIVLLIAEALPAAINGVESAKKLVELGRDIFTKVADEDRDATPEEIASVRALREDRYDDFYTDDEAKI